MGPRDERALLLNVQINPRTKAQFLKMLADKRALYLLRVKGLSPRNTKKGLGDTSSVRKNRPTFLQTIKHKSLSQVKQIKSNASKC